MNLCTSVQRLGVCAAMLSFAFVTLGPATDFPPARHAFGQTKVLPANPGLDGGKGGHWGAKNDKHWVDDR